MSCVIFGNDIEHPVDGLHFTDNIIVVTDRTLVDTNIGRLKRMIQENYLILLKRLRKISVFLI